MFRKKSVTFCILLSLIFVFGNTAPAFAAGPDIVAAPGSGEAVSSAGGVQAVDFESAIEAAVLEAFRQYADSALPQIESVVTQEIDSMAGNIQQTVLAAKIRFDAVTTPPSQLDPSAFPSAEVIANIPDQALSQVKASVPQKVESCVSEQFESTAVTINENVGTIMKEIAPQVKEQIKPAIQSIVPKINDVIENGLQEKIEAKITEVLPGYMNSIPAELANLSPDEIADKMQQKIRPKVEGVIRPAMESKIREAVDRIIAQKIEKPVEELMQPRFGELESSVLQSNIDKVPSYLEKLISKDTIRSVVTAQINKLKAKLPEIIEAQRNEMKNEIKTYVDEEINNTMKIYIGSKRINTDVMPRIIKSRLMVPFKAIAQELGAEVKWVYDKKQVVMNKGGTEIVLTLDSDTVLVNGKPARVDAPPTIVDNRTMVPVRFIAETFGQKIDWQPDWKMVNIK